MVFPLSAGVEVEEDGCDGGCWLVSNNVDAVRLVVVREELGTSACCCCWAWASCGLIVSGDMSSSSDVMPLRLRSIKAKRSGVMGVSGVISEKVGVYHVGGVVVVVVVVALLFDNIN